MRCMAVLLALLSLSALLVSCGKATSTSASVHSQVASSMVEQPIAPSVPVKKTFDYSPEKLLEDLNALFPEPRLRIPLRYSDGNINVICSGFSGNSSGKIVVFCTPDFSQIKAVSVSIASDSNQENTDAITALWYHSLVLCLGSDFDEAQAEAAFANMKPELPQSVGSAEIRLLIKNNNRLQMIVSPNGTDMDVENLPLQIEWPENSFLGNPVRLTELKQSLSVYDFSAMEQQLTSFIETAQPSEDDISHILLASIRDEKLQQILSKCQINVDPVENKANVFYNGMKSITPNVNLFAFLKNGEPVYRAGTMGSDWTFFESYQIAVGDGNNIHESFDYFDVTRDVISGGVLEYADLSLMQEEDLQRIYDAENPILRFSDEKGDKTKDHIITQDEKDCLIAITHLKQTYRELSDDLFHLETVFLES